MTQTFADFSLPLKLQQALERAKFTTPTPIQAQAIPLALRGKDVLGSAQTGTGKTGAFGIPLIAKLMDNQDAVALVLTPTRELAAQVMAAMQQWIAVPHIKTALLIGGEPMHKQYRQLHMKPRLIVGTPGRVNDHLLRKTLRLEDTRFLVLDETDRMLDMGFGVQLDAILQYLPAERQTMMFSATLPQNIIKLSSKYLTKPQRVSVGSTIAVAPKIKQELIQLQDADKYNELTTQLSMNDGSFIIFVKTKYGADKLATKLCRDEIKADAIHGDLKQSRRDRVIREFRDKKFRVLVATDVAARGLDIPHIETVVNYDLPQCPEDYIHRIGRTARAGAEGYAINFLSPADGAKWKAIHRMMNPDAKSERSERPANARGQGGYKQAGYKQGGGFGGRRSNSDGGFKQGGFGGGQSNRGGFPGFENKTRDDRFGGRSRSNDGSVAGAAPRRERDNGFNDMPRGEERPAQHGGFAAKKPFGGHKPGGFKTGPKPFGKPGAKAPAGGRRFAKKPTNKFAA